jgi:hypothetical protein
LCQKPDEVTRIDGSAISHSILTLKGLSHEMDLADDVNSHSPREILFLRYKIIRVSKYLKTGRVPYLSLELTMHAIKSTVPLINQQTKLG